MQRNVKQAAIATATLLSIWLGLTLLPHPTAQQAHRVPEQLGKPSTGTRPPPVKMLSRKEATERPVDQKHELSPECHRLHALVLATNPATLDPYRSEDIAKMAEFLRDLHELQGCEGLSIHHPLRCAHEDFMSACGGGGHGHITLLRRMMDPNREKECAAPHRSSSPPEFDTDEIAERPMRIEARINEVIEESRASGVTPMTRDQVIQAMDCLRNLVAYRAMVAGT